MTYAPSRRRSWGRVVLTPVSLVVLTAAGCSGASAPVAIPSPSATPPSPSPSPTVATPAPSPTASASASAEPAAACVQQSVAGMTEEQRLGQLLMVGFDTAAPLDALDREISSDHVGNVIYLGGWEGADTVTRTSSHLQELTSETATGDVGLLIAADQEGGEVHQLRGEGFTRPPSATKQAQLAPAELTARATTWAKQLKAAGVNVNLAPVTDTVPQNIGTANEPIGKYGRQYGSDPKTVERASTAFLKGMLAGGVEGTVKHFPGLGRIRSNTDFNSTGITDDVTTAKDPFLEPFAAGVDAGAGLVMVGSAKYSKLDKGVPAMFSEKIVTDLLRGDLGYAGVVITDDVNAAAVEDVPAAQRAVRFEDAGGDNVLTGDASVAPAMLRALADQAAADPAFAKKVDAAVVRVLTLKERMGLLPCSTATSP
ncbi:MAG: glycoside hydrolase family 3 N-terminal domain-containing protein [Ornithinibacter sp.]